MDGDRKAFVCLVERYVARLEAFALRQLADPSRAQDVAQETLLKLWTKAADYDPAKASLSTWLHQIAYNACIDQMRKDKRSVLTEDGFCDNRLSDEFDLSHIGEPVVRSDESAAEQARETAEPVLSALSRLPERQRSALVLTYYQDMNNREVAAVMGLSVRAVESLLVRARKALKELLEVENGCE